MAAVGTQSPSGRLLGIDIRSLAALRITLAAIQLGYLYQRFGELKLFLTDQGVLPATLLRESIYGTSTLWSLYFMDGSFAWAVVVWSLHVMAAAAMLVGWRTHWAILVCLVAAWSMQVRNPFILTAGDVMLRMALVWLLWLPCHRWLSLDARRLGPNQQTATVVVSWGTMGIMTQLACMYFFAGLAKWNEYWWSGQATEMALQLEIHVTTWGERLLDWPTALAWATWGTLAIELAVPLLLWSPWKTGLVRLLAAALFIALHLGVWLTFSVGWLSLIAISVWLIFVPGRCWDRLGLPLHSAGTGPFEKTPRGSIVTRLRLLSAAALWSAVLILNIMSFFPAAQRTSWGQAISRVGNALMITQEFRMFGTPPLVSPTFVYSGQTRGGQTVDPFRQITAPTAAPAHRPYDQMASHAWRRWHWHLVDQPYIQLSDNEIATIKRLRDRLLTVIVESYNAQQAEQDQLVSAQLTCNHRPIRAPHDPSLPSTQQIWAHWSQ